MPDVERSPEIDRFRGLAIVLMVFANYFAGISWVPAWLKHAPDIGFTCIDAIAPLFIFAIALTYSGSFRRSLASQGLRNTALKFIRRYTSLVGTGAIFSAGEVWIDGNQGAMNWGVLQAIGVAGLMALCFMGLSPWIRLVIGAAVMAAYQVLLDRFWLTLVLSSSHGGFPGSLSWGAMLLVASGLADLIDANTRPNRRSMTYVLFGVVVSILGLALGQFVPISKNRVSASYDTLSIGISAIVFGLAASRIGIQTQHDPHREKRQDLVQRGPNQQEETSRDKVRAKSYGPITRFLIWWGRNPIFLYILHLILLGLVQLPGAAWWYSDANPLLVAFQFTLIMGLLTVIAHRLYKRHIVISL